MSQRVDRITDEAALWFVRAQERDFPAGEREELASWFAASAEHVQAYLSVAAVTQELAELPSTDDIDALIELASASSEQSNVIPLIDPGIARPDDVHKEFRPEAAQPVPTEARPRRRFIAAAASVLLAALVGFFVYVERDSSDQELYTTGVGEQASFPLQDGSVITLNAQSALRVDYGEEAREIELMAGEAMFDVERDPGRPFRVTTDRAVIEAVGTQFNVRSRGDNTTVTVVEGIVDVQPTAPNDLPPGESVLLVDDVQPGSSALAPSSRQLASTARLTVGQQARVNGGALAVFEANVQKTISWRARRLVFEAWTLKDVVSEFNIYNDQQFVIHDPVLETRAISGSFSADDRESFALFLSETGLAVPERRVDGTIELRAIQPIE